MIHFECACGNIMCCGSYTKLINCQFAGVVLVAQFVSEKSTPDVVKKSPRREKKENPPKKELREERRYAKKIIISIIWVHQP